MLLFSAINSLYCQEENREENLSTRKYSFSFGPLAGFAYGQSFEYVYKFYEPSQLLSELVWDMKPVFYVGLQTDFNRSNLMDGTGLFASLKFKAGFPSDSGNMQDRDWISPAPNELTHYSKHTNKTTRFLSLDFSAGASIPVVKLFYIKPLLAFSWMHFYFSAQDGYGTYAFENWQFHPFFGEVITYKQNWLLLSPGVSLGVNIGSILHLEISFKYTPFTFCIAEDHHKSETKKIIYRDYSGWGHFIEPAGSLSFNFKKADLTLEMAYRRIGRTRGNSYINDNGADFYLSMNQAGAALSLIDIRIIIKVIF